MASGATDTVVALEYEADTQAGCIAEDEVRRLVTTHLGRDPFRADAERKLIITINETGVGFEGRIVWAETTGRSFGERRLESRSPDCRDLGANVAFAVAVQIQLIDFATSKVSAQGSDSGSAAAQSTPSVAGSPAPPRSAEAALAATPPADADSSPPKGIALRVGAGPALAVGMAPEATALGRLFVAAHLGRLSAEIAVDGALPATQTEADGSGIVVGVRGLSLAGCVGASFLSACLLGRHGWLRARGTGIDEPSSSSARFNEVGGRLGLTNRRGNRFDVSLHADGLVMLSRWNVWLHDAVIWSTPRLGVIVGADLAVRFF